MEFRDVDTIGKGSRLQSDCCLGLPDSTYPEGSSVLLACPYCVGRPIHGSISY